MKLYLLLLLVFPFSVALAQKDEDLMTTGDISVMERSRYAKSIDPFRLAAKKSGSENFDVTYYRCQWEVDPNVKMIAGTVTTHFIMKSAGNIISLDLSDNLNVTSVKRGNAPLQFTHSSNTIAVTFPEPIAPGIKDSVSITYSGVPTSPNGSFVVTTHGAGETLAPVLWTLSEPFGSREWWPCKNGLGDKADSIDVYITHPNAYKAVSNGVLQSETDIAGTKKVSYWKHRYPIASYLVCMAVSNYQVLNHAANVLGDNITMQTFCYPENQGVFAAGAVNALSQIDFYSNLLEKYPFRNEKYGHVQFGWGGGMEHQTGSFIVNMNESLIAHELAHQWFGDKITCGNWEDIWLNEGFATHLASMFMEHKYPANAIKNRKAGILSVTSDLAGSVKVSDVTNINRIFDQRLSYKKGSHLLYMLRWILGEATFTTALKNYLQDPALAYGFATTALLKEHLETASGKDLTYFFDQWFTGEGYPTYQIEWFTKNNSVQVKVNQNTSHVSVGFFQLPVPLLFRNTVTNEQKLVVLDNHVNGQEFIEELGFVADDAVFDPEAWLITRNNVITKLSDPLPVTFGGFSSVCGEKDVTLTWETFEEVNAGYYEVQKSSDAVKWQGIGRIPAVGNSQGKQVYLFNDPGAAAEQSYYRIVERDLDGKQQYTRIVFSKCNQEVAVEVVLAPNPVRDELIFNIRHMAEDLRAAVYMVNGNLADTRLSGLPVNEHTNINVAGLSGGLYILKLFTRDGRTVNSVRFLKE
jgi:hypothetical protein